MKLINLVTSGLTLCLVACGGDDTPADMNKTTENVQLEKGYNGSRTIELDPKHPYLNTGIYMNEGQSLKIRVEGQVNFNGQDAGKDKKEKSVEKCDFLVPYALVDVLQSVSTKPGNDIQCLRPDNTVIFAPNKAGLVYLNINVKQPSPHEKDLGQELQGKYTVTLEGEASDAPILTKDNINQLDLSKLNQVEYRTSQMSIHLPASILAEHFQKFVGAMDKLEKEFDKYQNFRDLSSTVQLFTYDNTNTKLVIKDGPIYFSPYGFNQDDITKSDDGELFDALLTIFLTYQMKYEMPDMSHAVEMDFWYAFIRTLMGYEKNLQTEEECISLRADFASKNSERLKKIFNKEKNAEDYKMGFKEGYCMAKDILPVLKEKKYEYIPRVLIKISQNFFGPYLLNNFVNHLINFNKQVSEKLSEWNLSPELIPMA
jgi:hypothetical protein